METLDQYFSYNKDCDISAIFYKLYHDMKIIHSNGMFIPLINSEHIIYDDGFSFDSMALSDNIEIDKKANILALTKLFLGTYLSLSTNFRDFSSVDSDWFSQNITDINSVISDEGYLPDYFNAVLLDEDDSYYCDFVDKTKLSQDLGDRDNVVGYKKVLSNASSKLYQDQSETDDLGNIVGKNTAFINYLFYSLIFLSLVLIGFVVYTCFKYLPR